MKKVVIIHVIALLLLNLTAMAQEKKVAVSDSTGKLVAKGSKVFMNSKQLDEIEIRRLFANTNALNIYNEGVKKNNAGTALTVIGAGFVAGGAIMAFVGGFYDEVPRYYKRPTPFGGYFYDYEIQKKWSLGAKIGVPLMAVGGLCVIVGVPMKLSGMENIHDAVDSFNYRNMPTGAKLNIGVTGNGFGLVLNF